MSQKSKTTEKSKESESENISDEMPYKCYFNDEEVPCRNISRTVPKFCKLKTVEGIRTSSMSCHHGTPIRLDSENERLDNN